MGYDFTTYHYTMKRMQAYDTSRPTKHGSCRIVIQARVEAKLNEQGITRYDLGREKVF